MKRKSKRDIEKVYSATAIADKLRRLADALENGERFAIQVAGERIIVPVDAAMTIEHERSGGVEELEIELKWKC